MNAWRSDFSMGHNLHNQIAAHDRLIVALDVNDVNQARQIVGELGDTVTFYKIGLWLYLNKGILDFAVELAQAGKQIFWDVKGGDIPESLRGYSTAAAQVGFKFLTIHGNGDVTDAAIQAAIEGKKGASLKVLLVTVLTSLSDEDVQSIYNVNSVKDLMVQRVKRAIRLGCDGVIASGKEAALIRQLANDAGRNDFLIVTPGIRPHGAPAHDQKRIATPYEAIRDGADYLVVGRPILEASDRRQAASSIISEIKQGLADRQ